MTFHTLNELIADGVRGRYVLVRSDLNVPLDGSTVTDDGRIKASLPVLAKLTDAGARVLVTAHLGRPKGAPEDKYSLKPAAARLAELAGSRFPWRRTPSGSPPRHPPRRCANCSPSSQRCSTGR